VTVQQAGSATQSNPQIFAGPGGFSFQSADGANQVRFHGEFDFRRALLQRRIDAGRLTQYLAIAPRAAHPRGHIR